MFKSQVFGQSIMILLLRMDLVLSVFLVLFAYSGYAEIVKESKEPTVGELLKIIEKLNDTLVTENNLLKEEISSLKTRDSRRAQNHPVVAFSVNLHNDISLMNHQIAIYERVDTNIGNGYSNTSGRFVAPVKGVYWFGFATMAQNNYITVELVKNGIPIANGYGNRFGTNSAVTKLEIGDQVYVRHFVGSSAGPQSMRGDRWSSFAGCLITQM